MLILRLIFGILGIIFSGNNPVIPWTDRLREMIAGDVDDLHNYGAYYPTTPHGQLATQAAENLRGCLGREGAKDKTLKQWAALRDSFGNGPISTSVASDPEWLNKLGQLNQVAAVMAQGR